MLKKTTVKCAVVLFMFLVKLLTLKEHYLKL